MLVMLWLYLNTQGLIVVPVPVTVLMCICWFFFDIGTIVKVWGILDRCKSNSKGVF